MSGYPQLELLAGSPLLGIDVGGTDIKSTLVDSAGTVIATETDPTEMSSAEALADQLDAIVVRTARAHPRLAPQAVGVLVPGIVDDARGIVLEATNLGLTNAPLRDMLEERTGLPVGFRNDARGAATAEFVLGAARDYESALVVSIGTGIGAGIYVDGRMYDADGYGCELGHMRTQLHPSADVPRCSCGGYSCLETFCSAAWITRNYREATGTKLKGARQVFAAAASGDTAAGEVIDTAISALALAFAQVTAILSPQVIVVAGGLSRAGDALFVPLRAKLESMLTFQRVPAIVQARFGHEAGVIASALAADERLHATRAQQTARSQTQNQAQGVHQSQ